jgi:hypothetical protein
MNNGQYFNLRDFGFQIGVPDGWIIQDTVAVKANRERIVVEHPILQQRFQQAAMPIFVSTRFPDGHDDVNPTVQVVFRPVPELGAPAAVILEKILGGMAMILPEFKLLLPVSECELGGQPAAHARVAFVMQDDDQKFNIVARSWVVPRGEMMFMVGLSGPAEGEYVSEDEFVAIADSVRIDAGEA